VTWLQKIKRSVCMCVPPEATASAWKERPRLLGSNFAAGKV